MSLFIVDTAGDAKLSEDKNILTNTTASSSAKWLSADTNYKTEPIENSNDEADEVDSEDDGDYFGLPPPNVDLSKIINSTLQRTARAESKVEQSMTRVTEQIQAMLEQNQTKQKPKKRNQRQIVELDHSSFNANTGKFDDTAELMQTDVQKELAQAKLQANFEQLKSMPALTTTKQKQLNRLQRAETKGASWFDLPATELTEEVQNDLKLLQMRSVLDPKHFYKKNDLKVLPKYFQIGTVQHSPLDYYNERGTRRNKKHSLVDELLADDTVMSYTKRKYKDIMSRKDFYARRKAMRKLKKLKKK